MDSRIQDIVLQAHIYLDCWKIFICGIPLFHREVLIYLFKADLSLGRTDRVFEKLPILINLHRRRSRGGGDVSPPPPLEFFWGGSSPLDFWKLEKYLFIYLHFKHNESNTKLLIQHNNTTKHTKSLNLPRASRADSRPNHISASLALPAISVAGGGGGGAGGQFVGTFRNLSLHVSRQLTSMSFVPTKYLKYQQNIERNSSFRM